MDIASLINPSPSSEDSKAETSSSTLLQKSQTNLSPVFNSSPSRRHTIASMLNKDEYDFLQHRVRSSADCNQTLALTPNVLPDVLKRPGNPSANMVSTLSYGLNDEPQDVIRDSSLDFSDLHEVPVDLPSYLLPPMTKLPTPTICNRADLAFNPSPNVSSDDVNKLPAYLPKGSQQGSDLNFLPPKPNFQVTEPSSASNNLKSIIGLPTSLLLHDQPETPLKSTPLNLRKPSARKAKAKRKPDGGIKLEEVTKQAGTQKWDLSSIKPKSRPRRYESPPIWAQSYRKLNNMPMVQTCINFDIHPLEKHAGSYKPVTEQIKNLSGLPPSLTNVLQFEELTRKVTEWLFGSLQSLGEDRQYAEVEVKLGRIIQKDTGQRLSLPVLTETAVTTDFAREKTTFVSSVSDEQFRLAMEFLKVLAKESKKGLRKPTYIEAIPKVYMRDEIYRNYDGGRNFRLTFNSGNELIEQIDKKKVDHLAVYSPGDRLDFRITVSVEVPVSEDEVNMKVLKKLTERCKTRVSYKHAAFQADLTTVISDKTKMSNEVELEVNKDLLLQNFNSTLSGDRDASIKFEEFVRFLIDNTRLVLRKVAR